MALEALRLLHVEERKMPLKNDGIPLPSALGQVYSMGCMDATLVRRLPGGTGKRSYRRIAGL